jgi:hypothetical protein
MIRVLLASFAIAAAASAQTFVVDAANGPGANFTDLQVAIDTVPDGSILSIRPGSYVQAHIDGKSLSLLADGSGVLLGAASMPGVPPIDVRNLGASQAVTLRGLSIGFHFFDVEMNLQACAGLVLIDGFVGYYVTPPAPYVTPPVPATPPIGIACHACSEVVLRNSIVSGFPAVQATTSTMAIETTQLIGLSSPNAVGVFWSNIGGTALDATNCILTCSRDQMTGGNGGAYGGPGPAIQCTGSTIRLCEDAQGNYAPGSLPGRPTAAIEGSAGTVLRTTLASVVGVYGSGGVANGLTDLLRPLPSLRTQSAAPGGTVHADVTTPIGGLVLLALALPGPAQTVPGIDGASWLDPSTATLMAVGSPGFGQPVRCSVAVPSGPGLVGARFGWQAFAWVPASGLFASNPSLYAN